jgi:hypothetical protein
MPPVAAALLPHPPLLVPELAGAAAPELDPLRAACRTALATVLAASDVTILVGDGPVWGVPEPSAPGSFQPYGAEVEVTLPTLVDLDLPDLPPPTRLARLPLSLAVAAHLSGLDPLPTRLAAATVPASVGPGAAAAIGHALAAAARGVTAGPEVGVGQGPPVAAIGRVPSGTARRRVPPATGRGRARVGLVAMGDLSACRTDRAPGAFREEAAAFDGSVAAAFESGRPDRLLGLDPVQAADLLVAGRVALQVLAGAFDRGEPQPGPPLRGQVLYDDAPYGVGYLVALLAAP